MILREVGAEGFTNCSVEGCLEVEDKMMDHDSTYENHIVTVYDALEMTDR